MPLRLGYTTVRSSRSRSVRAGLHFPVGRVHRLLRKGPWAARIGVFAPVYLAAVLEYLTAEIFELAGILARDAGGRSGEKVRIEPRHLLLAIRQDSELDELFEGAIVGSGGVLPNINPALLRGREDE